ncbi:MAG TPA: MBL fold metallo-hydrolase [Ottowia sp.]|uniref:MBL fold metallo-hydrolase n=1 Tax=Ottowia sp. TaxID=1898956 RepID=UPI002C535CDF|nr:MBL fold metallo-hydrolase [Ottowia sp.]HMN21153.1 MBL fold metallo-hydrolase [Ottowia sp.]
MRVNTNPAALPDDIRVFDRGWLSSSNVLCLGDRPALIDTGHVKHADQTVARVRAALDGQALATIAHTHLHSDHCGGTGALQAAWPAATTWVPEVSLATVQAWDEQALTFGETGQRCARFRAERGLRPGSSVRLGRRQWDIHPAPGHDPLAVLLFEPEARLLVAGDALWEHGVGLIFPVLDGSDGFVPYLRTLDAIEALQPDWVIPGHGPEIARATGAIDRALAQARSRIAHWQAHPEQHALHAVRVMIKYQFMDVEAMPWAEFAHWIDTSPLLRQVHQHWGAGEDWETWWRQLVDAMVAKGTLGRTATHILDHPG